APLSNGADAYSAPAAAASGGFRVPATRAAAAGELAVRRKRWVSLRRSPGHITGGSHMHRQLTLWLVALGVSCGVNLEAAAQKNSSPRVRETEALMRLLDEPINLKDLKDAASLPSLEQSPQARPH